MRSHTNEEANPSLCRIIVFRISVKKIYSNECHSYDIEWWNWYGWDWGWRPVVLILMFCGQFFILVQLVEPIVVIIKVIGVHIEGGMQEVIRHPAHLLTKVPDNLPVINSPLWTFNNSYMLYMTLKSRRHKAIIGAGYNWINGSISSSSMWTIPILVDI